MDGDSIYLKKRPSGDVWQGLFEPYLLESDSELNVLPNRNKDSYFEMYQTKRILSHQRLFIKFWAVGFNEAELATFIKVKKTDLDSFPVPKSIEQLFLSKEFVSLFY